MANKIILIGGAPTTGKTTLAKQLSKEFNLPWICTNTIRNMMREILDPKLYPGLFKFSNPTIEMATDLLTKNIPKKVVEYVNKESKDEWKGISAIILTDDIWDTVIIEGIAILPMLVNSLSTTKKYNQYFWYHKILHEFAR